MGVGEGSNAVNLNLDLQLDRSVDVSIGCEECPSRRTLHFAQPPAAILAGVDTTGVDVQIAESFAIALVNRTPEVMINSRDYKTTFNFKQIVGTCEKPCTRIDRIRSVAEALVLHANSNTNLIKE